MKLVSFIKDGASRTGVVNAAGGVVDLTALGFPGSMNELIAGGKDLLERVADALTDDSQPTLRLDSLEYDFVTRPQKIVCVGLNYRNHAAETGVSVPKSIVFFSKFNDALTPAGRSVKLPEWQSHYDYEAELVIVIGRTAWNVPADAAENYIFGYTCGNDLSARDSQFLSSQWLAGKSFPGFAPAGPVIVTADSFDPDGNNGIVCDVEGSRMQSGYTSDMIFSCREIVSAASRYFRLNPGDLIFTGTPSGVIMGKPKGAQVWLKPGRPFPSRSRGSVRSSPHSYSHPPPNKGIRACGPYDPANKDRAVPHTSDELNVPRKASLVKGRCRQNDGGIHIPPAAQIIV
jgi:2-keto-4-pentenoate hydratase/2-oxohepta-3-ene-1,7-dioic acid hydratase in catechol pathway